MRGAERLDPQCGPFGNLWQTYSNALDLMAKRSEPAALRAGRLGCELMALSLRRAQAWLEMPARLGACRTAPDLLRAQIAFWQAANADYADGSQRLLAALLSTQATSPSTPDPQGRQPRDYIAMADVKEAPAVRQPNDRRAA
jgi:hypothetical protein